MTSGSTGPAHATVDRSDRLFIRPLVTRRPVRRAGRQMASSPNPMLQQLVNVQPLTVLKSKCGQELDVSGRSGQWRLCQVQRRRTECLRCRECVPDHLTDVTAGSRTTPPLPTWPRPASNWGLISGTHHPPRLQDGRGGRQHQLERDERDVDHDQIDRLRQRFEQAHIGPLHDNDTFVIADTLMQLPVPDVDRVDLARHRAPAGHR